MCVVPPQAGVYSSNKVMCSLLRSGSVALQLLDGNSHSAFFNHVMDLDPYTDFAKNLGASSKSRPTPAELATVSAALLTVSPAALFVPVVPLINEVFVAAVRVALSGLYSSGAGLLASD